MKQPTVITAGLDSPGFSADTTTWLLEIDGSGQLIQTIKQDVGPTYRHKHTTIKSNEIPLVDLEDLLETADRVGFLDLPDQLRANISDQETRHLSVRRGKSHKQVSVYGAIFLTRDVSDRRIWQFVELWEQVMRFAVYADENSLTLAALDRAAGWTAEERRREEAQRNAFEAAAWARGARWTCSPSRTALHCAPIAASGSPSTPPCRGTASVTAAVAPGYACRAVSTASKPATTSKASSCATANPSGPD